MVKRTWTRSAVSGCDKFVFTFIFRGTITTSARDGIAHRVVSVLGKLVVDIKKNQHGWSSAMTEFHKSAFG